MAKEKTAKKTVKSKEQYVPRMKSLYFEKILPQLMKDLGMENKMEVPRIQKIVVNMGLGESAQDAKYLEEAIQVMRIITGQHPTIRRAKKSISAFGLRQGAPVGLKVTLRGNRMYDFFDRLISVALPRVRDFKGLPPRQFDGSGNFTFGIDDQLIFPEIDVDSVKNQIGMDISIITTARDDDSARALLELFGFPFRK